MSSGPRLGGQAGVRDGDGQVEPRLVGRDVEELLVERPVHEHVGPDPEQDRGERNEGDEGERSGEPGRRASMPPPQRTAL